MKKLILLLTFLVLPGLSGTALAGSHEHDHGKMDHGKMEHSGMTAKGDMIMLGNQTIDGVTAMAHVKDVRKAMAKMGMSVTHHFMVAFVDQKSGDPIETGVVALKITDPFDLTCPPIKLMGMEGHFGGDFTIKEKGDYVFLLGTKLADGKSRQFKFKYDLK